MAFETRKQFIKHNLADEHLNRARRENEDELDDETKEKVYDAEEDDYILKPKNITKDNIKDINKTKTITNTKAEAKAKTKTEDNNYTRISRIRYE